MKLFLKAGKLIKLQRLVSLAEILLVAIKKIWSKQSERASHPVCVWLFATTHAWTVGSSVHEILQARILEWIAIPFSSASSRPRDWTLVYTAGDSLLSEPPGEPMWNIFVSFLPTILFFHFDKDTLRAWVLYYFLMCIKIAINIESWIETHL